MAKLIKNKKYYIDRYGELDGEYSAGGWLANDEEKTRYLYPHGRNLDEAHRGSDGKRKDEYILNNTALTAIRILVSGLFSGITPPTEKWFRLADRDKELNENAEVSAFYQKSADVILGNMAKSNFYTVMELVYKDLVTYSYSSVITDADPDNAYNFTHLPNGQYRIDVDGRGQVSAVYRKFTMRARNVIAEYGEENVSKKVNAMMSGNKTGGGQVILLHAMERNTDRDVTKIDNKNMPWTSVTYEFDRDNKDDKPLRSSGYRTKSFAVPRWSVSSGNIYGNGPGDIALGDQKQLQKLASLLLLAVEKDLKPPLIGPDIDVATGPNELTIVDKINSSNRPVVDTLYRTTTDISKLAALIIDTQDRIRKAYFNDLFFTQAQVTDPKKTATQVRAEQRELLRLLGPITQRMTPELLQDLILRCFDIELNRSGLPEVPEILIGRELKVEIISSLSKAQELGVITPIEQMIATIGLMAEAWPQVLDKFDAVQAVDVISKALGIEEGVIRPDEVFEQLQQIKLQAAQQEQQAQQRQENIDNAKQLSETDVGGNNALGAIIGGAS